MKRALMVWGTSSGAGKSLLATALCRLAARRGIDVAPFKAQNMSNNARVVPGLDGGFGEIGAAQYFQALAAGVAPTVDMNPVLLKPERDTTSQVVVQGRVDAALSVMPWRSRSDQLAVTARASFQRLQSRHELIVIEGAGSPAEINLAANDYVNLGTARWAAEAGKLTSLLVTDIDRGGAFAHLYGTWAMLPQPLRSTLSAFVLNKFRGDAALLAPGPEQLFAMTGVPIAGVLPMWRDHGLPEEDAVFDVEIGEGNGPRVAIVTYPRISNLDEFQPLRRVPGLRLIWARSAAALSDVDWIILPGSKQVSGDLEWMRSLGLDHCIVRHAASGKRVLGICGGLQMLGVGLADPSGIDGEPGIFEGLGLLSLATTYDALKRVAPVSTAFVGVRSPWSELNEVQFDAYEIRSGVTRRIEDLDRMHPEVREVMRDEHEHVIGWQCGSVIGIYAHGMFESQDVLKALFGSSARPFDDVFHGLADFVEHHVDDAILEGWLRPHRPSS